MNLHIRWMIRRDMAQVLDIENQSFPLPWSEDTFLKWLRQRNCIGMVAERDERIFGYMMYEFRKTYLHLHNIAAAPQRHGVGTALVNKLKAKMSSRNRLTADVRETNLDAQLFFKAMGFEAVKVIHDAYEEVAEDAYRFVYRLKQEAMA